MAVYVCLQSSLDGTNTSAWILCEPSAFPPRPLFAAAGAVRGSSGVSMYLHTGEESSVANVEL